MTGNASEYEAGLRARIDAIGFSGRSAGLLLDIHKEQMEHELAFKKALEAVTKPDGADRISQLAHAIGLMHQMSAYQQATTVLLISETVAALFAKSKE